MSTEKFNVGDLVQCVDVRGIDYLVLGDCYEVIDSEVNLGYVVVKARRDGSCWVTGMSRFELVTPAGGWKEGRFDIEQAGKEPPYIRFSEPFEDTHDYKASCSHPEVVQSHALGQFFNYCRTCKQEVE